MAATTNATPLLDPTATMHPLFTVVSRTPASTATGEANATTSKSPDHKHTPDCEHDYNVNHHNYTIHQAHNATTESEGHATEEANHEGKSKGHLSPYPGFNASAYAHPHAVQERNHTGRYCNNHPSHHNTTATDATDAKMLHSKMLNTSKDSFHNHTEFDCTHPSHHNGTTTTIAEHGHEKKSVVPEIEVTVCLGTDCKDSELMTANMDGKVTGVEVKNSKRKVRRQDTEISYEEVAREMAGARVAGGM